MHTFIMMIVSIMHTITMHIYRTSVNYIHIDIHLFVMQYCGIDICKHTMFLNIRGLNKIYPLHLPKTLHL